MTSETVFAPNWASPPGETIRDVLSARGLSIVDFANHVGKSSEYVSSLLTGKVQICTDIAREMSRCLGASETFWLTREKNYQAALLRIGENAKTAESELWLQNIPFQEMTQLGWLNASSSRTEKIVAAFRFFGVDSVDAWNDAYAPLLQKIALRTSNTFSSTFESITSWIRQGEIEASHISCAPLNKPGLMSVLPGLIALSRIKDPEAFVPELISLCATVGVAVVVLRSPTHCRASGVTFSSGRKRILMLSGRHLSDDHFWFTFLHECGHIVLHQASEMFVESDDGTRTKQEDEANEFASRNLIPTEFQEEFLKLGRNHRDIMQFARRLKISPGIVVGQLQNKKVLAKNQMNFLKRRFKWDNNRLTLNRETQ